MSTNKKTIAVEWIRSLILAVCIALFIRFFLFEIFIVEGVSMFPTLDDGDRIFVNKMAYWIHEPQKGDVVVVHLPQVEDKDLVKRIIATSGDTVLIENGNVFVNDSLLSEEYINQVTEGQYGPVTIPDDQIFVMGDNRNFSLDSRSQLVGFIDEALIKGHAQFVIWPINKWVLLN